ncbi:MAG: DUF4173 domain-containing protein [Chloroflexi bacterium]|nr:DUF4173 domain-containing protein [Chloroflexota bacterium]
MENLHELNDIHDTHEPNEANGAGDTHYPDFEDFADDTGSNDNRESRQAHRGMDRKTFALYSLLIGGLVGVIGNVLFYGKTVGISFVIFIVIAIAVTLASTVLLRQPLRRRNLWVLIPAIFFAAMVAVRADWQINMLNMGAALALCALALHYLPLSERIDLASFGDQVLGVFDAAFGALFAPLFEVMDAISWGFDRLQGNWKVVASVGRGLVITVPIVLVFGVLLASADAVFAGVVNRAMSWLTFPMLSNQVYQIAFIGVMGWMSCGALAYGVARRERLQHKERADKPKRKLPALGLIEGTIVLGSVDLLFGLFVVIQFAYFFGGQATVSVEGLTYSDYARRGFFELVALSVLTLGLVLALDGVTVRRVEKHTLMFRILAVILVALTGVILVSASQRMLLYEDAYGFTLLRVYTHVFMIWLGVLFVIFLLALFRVRARIFSLGVLFVMIGYVGTLDVMNVEQYITERNIARVQEGYDLDFYNLSSYSVDAAPPMIALYQAATTPPALQATAGQWLAQKLSLLDYERQTSGSTFLSANRSRDTAWAALNAIRDTLPEYEAGYFYRDQFYGYDRSD